MNGRYWVAACVLTSAGTLAASAVPGSTAPRRKQRAAPKKAAATRKPRPKPRSAAAPKSSVAPKPATRAMAPDEARMAVEMLGDAYDLLLTETHEVYHTRPSVPVAATVIRKLQSRMTKLGWPRSRFLAVNAIVMHPDHVPRDEFERETVEALRLKNQRIERVVDGQLRVATVVSLGGSCSSCHWTASGQSSKAATTWTVPLLKNAGQGQ